MDNFDLKKYLAEGKLLKEEIDFPELEDEFEGAMDAMVVEPEVYLKDILNASADEIVSDDYYEIMNAVEQGVYSKDEAVKLAKSWAKEKLSTLAEGKLIKEDITKLRGQELLDFFSFTKYMNVDLEELESEFEDAQNYGQFTDPANVEQDKKDFTEENGDRFLDTNEDKMSEYLGFEIDTEQMIDDYFLGEPKAVEFVHSDEDFEGWMDEIGSFWS
jgi:hypothetical protein